MKLFATSLGLLAALLAPSVATGAQTRLPLTPTEAASPVAERLRKLSDAQLWAAYQNPELEMRAEDLPPTGNGFFGAETPRFAMFQQIRAEIVRRGAVMQPFLLEFLRSEVRVENHLAPTSRFSGIGNRYFADALELLVQMREPSAALTSARTLVELLDSSATTAGARRAALYSIEQLTQIGFFKCQPHSGRDGWMVERAGALPLESSLARDDAARAAAWYREWLRGEGAQPARWLDMARQRARRILAEDDLEAIYCAVVFLSSSPRTLSTAPAPWRRRDDAPDQTAARLGEILAAAQQSEVTHNYKKLSFHEYLYRGRALPVSIGNWALLLSSYGAQARPYAGALMRLQDLEGTQGASFFDELSALGGKPVVAYCIGWLPRLEARLRELGVADNPYRYGALELDKLPEDELQRWAIFADRSCRYTVDRWAGRTFDDDAARLDWWKTAQNETPESWLRANLDEAVAQADAGNEVAQTLVRAALPNLPPDQGEALWRPTTQIRAMNPVPALAPFRVAWWNRNASRLRYDAARHALVEAPPN